MNADIRFPCSERMNECTSVFSNITDNFMYWAMRAIFHYNCIENVASQAW